MASPVLRKQREQCPSGRCARRPSRLGLLVRPVLLSRHGFASGFRFASGSASRRPFFVPARRARLSPLCLRNRGQEDARMADVASHLGAQSSGQGSDILGVCLAAPFEEDRGDPGPLRLRTQPRGSRTGEVRGGTSHAPVGVGRLGPGDRVSERPGEQEPTKGRLADELDPAPLPRGNRNRAWVCT